MFSIERDASLSDDEPFNLHESISRALNVLNENTIDKHFEVPDKDILVPNITNTSKIGSEDGKPSVEENEPNKVEDTDEVIRRLTAENKKLIKSLKKFKNRDKVSCKKPKCKSNNKKLRASLNDNTRLCKKITELQNNNKSIVENYNESFKEQERLMEANNKLQDKVTELQNECCVLTKKVEEMGKDLLTSMVYKNQNNEVSFLQKSIDLYKFRLSEAKKKCNKAIYCAQHYQEQLNQLQSNKFSNRPTVPLKSVRNDDVI